LTTIQQRGAEIIKARGKSSAASAASAALDTIRSLITPTPAGDWFSVAKFAEGNSYGIDDDLIYSFPMTTDGKSAPKIVDGLDISEYSLGKMKATEKELQEEKEMIAALI
jgi:malate dehydrogenase